MMVFDQGSCVTVILTGRPEDTWPMRFQLWLEPFSGSDELEVTLITDGTSLLPADPVVFPPWLEAKFTRKSQQLETTWLENFVLRWSAPA